MKIYKKICNKINYTLLSKLSVEKYARKIGVNIGKNCSFHGCPFFGSEPWLIYIGNNVKFSGQVTFITHDGSISVIKNKYSSEYKDILKFGKIVIEDNCFVGMRAIIMPGVRIKENSIIAAGSVVTKEVSANTVVGGNPAKFICTLEDFADKCKTNMPEYDKNNYNKHKKEVVLNMLENKMKI